MVVDFVLAWVDGSDPAFLATKRQFAGRNESEDNDANSDCRYRSESEMLRYWFRSVEKFTPWVHTIHFVTCGQKPEWLDESHPKLSLVNHQDYIPERYLPTFNANTIEMNFHRIKELAEHYVYFNDDSYILQPLAPDYFFKDGNPILDADLRYPKYLSYKNWCRLLFNDYCVVNNRFNIRKCIWEHWRKWFNLKELGFKRTRQNLTCFLANKTLPVGNYGHLAFPHLKSTLKEIWERYEDVLDTSSKQRFRADNQVNQWLCCAWNQAKGRFYPTLWNKLGERIVITPKNTHFVCDLIRNRAIPQICLNDTSLNTDYETSCEMMLNAFSSILPEKSSFEKN